MKKSISLFIIGIALLACTDNRETILKEIGTMPAFEEGYEQGVSACYTALHDGALYIAGGCNFPEQPAAEGGAKRYYKGIYKAIIGDTLVWEQVGTLPETSAYGVSVQDGEYWIIAGGINEIHSQNSVLRIDLANGCKIDTLPSLPCTSDNASGCIAKEVLYIAGGNTDGKASNRLWAINLRKPTEWKEISSMPSRARVQPVCAMLNDKVHIWGGFTPGDSTGIAMVHTDGICYDPENDMWSNLPHTTTNEDTITVSGGIATCINNTIYVAGGVNKHIFTDAISGQYNLISKDKYMFQPAEWYSFNRNLLSYSDTAQWRTEYCDKVFARAGAAIIGDDKNIYYIGGELKPGIRTPQIHRYRF